jgi:tetratricopeptide (TPR) repeat protein
MEIDNPVIQLCIAGTQAEFQHKIDEAKVFYEQAWQIQSNDYEACMAAHYMARLQKDPKIEFDWNQKALKYAGLCADGRVTPFLPSLFLNMGKSYEKLGDLSTAQHYYDKALQLGMPHQMDIE